MTVSELRRVLARHGFVPGRRLGQHFLCAPPVLRRIVEAADLGVGRSVLEVGPGVGALTRELAATGACVTAVELDRSLRPALLDVLAAHAADSLATAEAVETVRGTWPDVQSDLVGGRVRILWTDAVRLPWSRLAAGLPGPWRICSNLPYYITGPFLASLFAGELPWDQAVLLVQREAAERMMAVPGTKAYGAFTCLVRYHAEVERLLTVPPQAFLPPPEVVSAVVRLRRRDTPPTPAPRGPMLKVVRAAFAQRRKTLRNALAAGLTIGPAAVAEALTAAGIAPERRGETLDLVEFGILTQALIGSGLLAGEGRCTVDGTAGAAGGHLGDGSGY